MTEAVNNSGRKVLRHRVLIAMDAVAEKTGGGVYIPDTSREKDRYAQDTGTIVGMGAYAFNDYDESEKPEIGDRCDIKKYDGVFLNQGDAEGGVEYRVVEDDQILTILK
jgi:co-chaperonin GroES (HSP10)